MTEPTAVVATLAGAFTSTAVVTQRFSDLSDASRESVVVTERAMRLHGAMAEACRHTFPGRDVCPKVFEATEATPSSTLGVSAGLRLDGTRHRASIGVEIDAEQLVHYAMHPEALTFQVQPVDADVHVAPQLAIAMAREGTTMLSANGYVWRVANCARLPSSNVEVPESRSPPSATLSPKETPTR